MTSTGLAVYLTLGGADVDITSYVYDRDKVTIQRGYTNEGTESPQASTCTLTLDNRDGRFSSRNPAGPYFGQLTRNTPLKVYTSEGAPIASATGASGYLSTPDSAGLSITGDLELHIDTWIENCGFGLLDLASKYGAAGQRSWAVQQAFNGPVTYYWSADGTTLRSATSTVPTPPCGRRALRILHDVDNGAGGTTVTFYTSDRIDGAITWTQLGDPVTAATTTSIFDSTATVVFGKNANTSAINPTVQRLHRLRIYQGLGGTLRADCNPATQAAVGAGTFSDGTNTWTVGAGASITNTWTRFRGEVAAWPVAWDTSARDIYTHITASGALRRLGQGAPPLRSALTTGVLSDTTDVLAYWPCEEGASATRLAPLVGTSTLTVGTGVTLASSAPFDCSESIPNLGSGAIFGVIPAGTDGNVQIRWLGVIPASTPNNTVLLRLATSGTGNRWDLVYTTGGALTLNEYPYTSSTIEYTSGPIGFGVDDQPLRFSLELVQSGGNVAATFSTLALNATSGGTYTTTAVGRTVGHATTLAFNPGGASTGLIVGHVTVEQAITSMFSRSLEFNAYRREGASDRAYRLLNAATIPLPAGSFAVLGGVPAESTRLVGSQGHIAALDAVTEAAAVDGGLVYEPRRTFGVNYRALDGLLDQYPAATLSHSGGQLRDFAPTEDDANTRNKATVTRADGSSATDEITDTRVPLNTTDPSAGTNGAGTYDSAVTRNLAWDDECADAASWVTHLGTVDEPRYPAIGVTLQTPGVAADTALVQDLLGMDCGDRLVVTGMPTWMPPGDVTQLVIGQAETIDAYTHDITFMCEPESPYRGGTYGAYGAGDRWDSGWSSLNGAHNSSTTSLSVSVDYGPLWTTAGADVPFDIMAGPERMTVTAIAGGASPQTFTVTRSVNGVVIAHADNEPIWLADPGYYIF